MKLHKYWHTRWEMGTRRQKWHRAIYDHLISKGIENGKAYEIASKITNWA